jgi:hypothetical protein
MARSLLQEIAHQIFGGKTKSSHSQNNRNPRNKDYEKTIYKMKQAAFENKKTYEIAKLKAKSKGWI